MTNEVVNQIRWAVSVKLLSDNFWHLYNELSKYSIEYYPETVLPSYYRGKYFELTENKAQNQPNK